MSDPQNTEPVTAPFARENFVQLLRSRAEEAAAASVHHAALAQRYLELSQQFTGLAERADSSTLTVLRQALERLEGQISASLAPDSLPHAPSLSEKSPDPVQRASNSGGPVVVRSSATAASADGTTETQPAVPKPLGEANRPQSEPTKSGVIKNRTKNRRAKTRTLVERFRSVSPMMSRRIRVRAKKSDLQPRLRTATEELQKGGSSIATSMVLLGLSICLLSMVTWQLEIETPLDPIVCAFASAERPVEEPQPVEPSEEEQGEQTEEEIDEPVEEPEEAESVSESESDAELEEDPPMEPTTVADAEALPETANGTQPASVDNRSAAGRRAMLQQYGGSAASEAAVQRALEWLISVQHPQGYWDFISVGTSTHPGTINNPIGGTAYALLPFLAAGQTHKEGRYQKQVAAGLAYLTSVGVSVPAGYDLRGMINKRSEDKEPNEAYYVHGAATLALCEAFAMTGDRRLKRAAEGAARFIINSQDPQGGGWRYLPQQPGSTSVTAVQLMALAAAKKAGISVPDTSGQGVMHYLDSVQVDGAGRYGYEVERKQYSGARTAMALLCRMYLGWGRDDGDLRAGVALLDKAGPYDNLYSLYFATQVMKNWGGEEWERWNGRLRDDLVACQETDGPSRGSWKPRTGAIHAKQGGRLLTTILATLTLEVYYRYQPLLPPEPDGPSVAGSPAALP